MGGIPREGVFFQKAWSLKRRVLFQEKGDLPREVVVLEEKEWSSKRSGLSREG